MDLLGSVVGHSNQPAGMVMGGSVLDSSGLIDGAIRVVKIHPNGCLEEQRTDGRWHGGQALGNVVAEIGKDLTAVHKGIGLALGNGTAAKLDGDVGEGCVVYSLLVMRLLNKGRLGVCWLPLKRISF